MHYDSAGGGGAPKYSGSGSRSSSRRSGSRSSSRRSSSRHSGSGSHSGSHSSDRLVAEEIDIESDAYGHGCGYRDDADRGIDKPCDDIKTPEPTMEEEQGLLVADKRASEDEYYGNPSCRSNDDCTAPQVCNPDTGHCFLGKN